MKRWQSLAISSSGAIEGIFEVRDRRSTYLDQRMHWGGVLIFFYCIQLISFISHLSVKNCHFHHCYRFGMQHQTFVEDCPGPFAENFDKGDWYKEKMMMRMWSACRHRVESGCIARKAWRGVLPLPGLPLPTSPHSRPRHRPVLGPGRRRRRGSQCTTCPAGGRSPAPRVKSWLSPKTPASKAPSMLRSSEWKRRLCWFVKGEQTCVFRRPVTSCCERGREKEREVVSWV